MIKIKNINIEVSEEIFNKKKPLTIIPNEKGDYCFSEIDSNEINNLLDFEQASYNFKTNKHLFENVTKNENKQFSTTMEELNNLAKSPQTNVNKVIKINTLIKYYTNKDDLVNTVTRSINHNTNTKYTINYPELPPKNKGKKLKEQLEKLMKDFLENIDVSKQIRKECKSTFSEGTYFTYLRDNSKGTYGIVSYPLGLCVLTDWVVDGEQLIAIDMDKLKSLLQKNQAKYKNIKSSFIEFPSSVEEEIKNNYPPEVYKAYKDKSKLAILNPKRTGIHKVSNDDGDGTYAVSNIFVALPSLLMLETIEKTDRDLVLMKSKAIFYQKLRKELMGQDYSKTKNFGEIKWAQEEFAKAMGQKTVIYTSPAYAEDIKVVQAKTELTDTITVSSYRNKVMNSLGISFLANDSKSSFNTVEVSIQELLREINFIVEQFENTLNKYIKVVCEQAGISIEYAPTISIEKTENLDNEKLFKLIDVYYSKLGLSMKTIFDKLGLDYQTEVDRRKEENKNNIDEDVFYPHVTSFTVSGKEGDTISNNDKTAKTEENQNKDKDKQMNDKARVKSQQ